MKNFDAWFTTDRMAEAAEAEADRLQALWEEFVATQVVEVGTASGVDLLDAEDEDHPEHAIYTAWLALQVALDERQYRLEAEAEAKYHEDAEQVEREWEAHVAEADRMGLLPGLFTPAEVE